MGPPADGPAALRLRVYTATELARLLEDVGFAEIECFGNLDRRIAEAVDAWTPFGLSHLLGLISGARLNAKNTAIYISHITSRRQVEQDERVAKGIIDDGESANGI
jgi:hypothetical protein